MSISTAQIRGARGILNWSQNDLAKRTGVSTTSIGSIENGQSKPRTSTLGIIRETFEAAGLEFGADDGIRMRNDLLKIYQAEEGSNENIYLRVLEDILAEVQHNGGGEVLFAYANNAISPPPVIKKQLSIREAGGTMRFLVRNGDTHLLFPLKEYRYLPEGRYINNPIVVYGNKVAIVTEIDRKIVVFNDPFLAKLKRLVFETLWDIGDKPKKSIVEPYD